MNDIQVFVSKIKALTNRPAFMLDSDVAMAYGTTTKRINEAVKRNPDRFPEDFVFHLSKNEAESCGFDVFKVADCDLEDGRGKNLKYLPYGFTREGCNMLSAVLNTPMAIERSIQIMRAFSAMERGETASISILREMADRLAAMDGRIKEIESRPPVNINLPDDAALPISIERKRQHSCHFRKGLKFPEVREFIIKLRRAGHTLDEVTQAVKDRWPDKPEIHVTRAALGRFWVNVRSGKLKEFGIDITVH